MTTAPRLSGFRIRLFYWFHFVAIAASVPFFSYYYDKILKHSDGSDALELVGIILFIQYIIGAFANTIAGFLADKFKIENRVLSFCASFVVVGGFFIILPALNLNLTLEVKTLLIIGGIIINGIFLSPILPLINAETIEHLHEINKTQGGYGLFRVSGTISWMVATVLLGLLLYLTGNLVFIPLTFCLGFFVLGLTALTGIKTRVNPVKIPWQHLIKNKPFMRFLVFAFIQAFGLFSINNFTSIFFDSFRMTTFEIGLAFSVGALLEIPLMFLARPITKRWGNRWMIIVGTGFLLLKAYLLVLLAPLMLPWVMILVMLFSGLGYGLQINGIINLIDKWSHKDMKATYMSIYSMIGIYFASALGNLFCSLILKSLGAIWMMLINAFIITIGIIYFIIFVKE